MNKLIINLNHEFDIDSYSRNTTISNGKVYSYANVSFPNSNNYSELVAISLEEITDLVISKEGTSIYHLTEQSAKITSIYESLTSDGQMVLSIQIQFGDTEEE